MTDDVPQLRGPELTGSVLGGRYEVLGKLGVGGMASVYEGRRVGLHHRVAIKVLKPELCEDPSNVKRFLREARAASVIEHENIVAILDFGSTEAMPVYFVMEFLDGVDIKQLIKQEGQVPWERAHPILLQIVGALGAAHQKGIVHRDVKPANIFVVRRPNGDDWVKVLDFGIAKVVEEGLGGITRGLTMTNGLLGTVAFMAPEQARGGEIDARTDIYALGVVMYQMLTGQVPFKGTNPFMVLERHVNEPPQPPSELNPAIPPEAEAIVLRCLAKQPDYRFGSMAELAEALEAMQTQRIPGHEARRITQTERRLYAEPLKSPKAAETVFPVAATMAPDEAAPRTVAHAQPEGDREGGHVITGAYGGGNGGAIAPSQTAVPAAAPSVGDATLRVGGSSPGSPQASTTGRTQMLSHVIVRERPKRKSPKAAFFGVGVGVGIAAACMLTYLAMRSPVDPTAPEAPIATPPPSDPSEPAPTAAPAPVHADLKPFPAVPTAAAEQPNPELRDAFPTADAIAPTEAPPTEPPPTEAHKRPRQGRKGRDKPTAANASSTSATPTPPPAKEDPQELHPDLKNPYDR